MCRYRESGSIHWDYMAKNSSPFLDQNLMFIIHTKWQQFPNYVPQSLWRGQEHRGPYWHVIVLQPGAQGPHTDDYIFPQCVLCLFLLRCSHYLLCSKVARFMKYDHGFIHFFNVPTWNWVEDRFTYGQSAKSIQNKELLHLCNSVRENESSAPFIDTNRCEVLNFGWIVPQIGNMYCAVLQIGEPADCETRLLVRILSPLIFC